MIVKRISSQANKYVMKRCNMHAMHVVKVKVRNTFMSALQAISLKGTQLHRKATGSLQKKLGFSRTPCTPRTQEVHSGSRIQKCRLRISMPTCVHKQQSCIYCRTKASLSPNNFQLSSLHTGHGHPVPATFLEVMHMQQYCVSSVIRVICTSTF